MHGAVLRDGWHTSDRTGNISHCVGSHAPKPFTARKRRAASKKRGGDELALHRRACRREPIAFHWAYIDRPTLRSERYGARAPSALNHQPRQEGTRTHTRQRLIDFFSKTRGVERAGTRQLADPLSPATASSIAASEDPNSLVSTDCAICGTLSTAPSPQDCLHGAPTLGLNDAICFALSTLAGRSPLRESAASSFPGPLILESRTMRPMGRESEFTLRIHSNGGGGSKSSARYRKVRGAGWRGRMPRERSRGLEAKRAHGFSAQGAPFA